MMRHEAYVKAYQGSVVVAACLGLAHCVSTCHITSWGAVGLLVVLRVLVEWFAFRLPILGSGSLAFAVVFAAVLYDGPLAAAIVAVSGAVTQQDIAEHKTVMTMLFNAGQLVLIALVSGFVMQLLGQIPLAQAEALDSSGKWLLAGLVSAAVLASLNIVLVGTAIALIRRMRLAEVIQKSFRSYTLSLVALALLGLVLAQLLRLAGAPGTLLLVVPFAVARQTFAVYQEQAEAYRATVRSLVAAIEAKDPYTKGHSERVAFYARKIAERLRMPESVAQTIEWAAMLHDIGKIAIPAATLTKPSRLSDEEYACVKEHPTVAAKLLEGIDLLADIVPDIAAHHERPDAQGYPLGLSADQIPPGARVLSVADSFDAMTSDRAYRPRLLFDAAVCELRAVSGSQLDGRCVDALLEEVDAELVARLVDIQRTQGRASAETAV